MALWPIVVSAALSRDVDTTPGFILTEYDLDLRVLRGCYEGLKSPKKV